MGRGGWAAFVGFVLMLIEIAFIAFRFINFALVYEQPIIALLIDIFTIGFGLLAIFPAFIVAAVYSGDLNAANLPFNSPKANIGALAAFSCFLFIALAALLVYEILWFALKWFLHLGNQYSADTEVVDPK